MTQTVSESNSRLYRAKQGDKLNRLESKPLQWRHLVVKSESYLADIHLPTYGLSMDTFLTIIHNYILENSKYSQC